MANFMADYGPWGFIVLWSWSSIFKILVLVRRLCEFYMLSIFDFDSLENSLFIYFFSIFLLCFS